LEQLHGWRGQPDVSFWAYDHDRIGGNLGQKLSSPDLETKRVRDTMIELYRELPYEVGRTSWTTIRSRGKFIPDIMGIFRSSNSRDIQELRRGLRQNAENTNRGESPPHMVR
jgi:hypothetical protein